MIAPERFEVRSDDGTMIPVWRTGKGRPLVLVHGSVGNHHTWDSVLPYLEPTVSVLTVDRRSTFGDPESRYTLEREFEDVAAVVREAGESVDLVGHSMGGVCALGAALKLTNLRRLIVYEPPLPAEHEVGLADELDSIYAAGDLRGVLETFLAKGPKLSKESIDRMQQRPDWEHRARYLPREAGALFRWRPDAEAFAALQVPVLLLLGAGTSPGHVHRGYEPVLTDNVRNLAVREMPGQTHGAMIQAPELFARYVLDFLEGE